MIRFEEVRGDDDEPWIRRHAEFERVLGGGTMRWWGLREEFGEDSTVGQLGLYRTQDEERG